MELPSELSSDSGAEANGRPELEVIIGGKATEETVLVSPVNLELPFDKFQAEFHALIRGGDYSSKTKEELLAIREDLQAVRDCLSDEYAKVIQEMDQLAARMTWANGYLIDVNKVISSRKEPKSRET